MKSKHLYLVAALLLAVIQSCASADVSDVGGVGGSSQPGGNNGGGGQGGSFVLSGDASTFALPDVPKPVPDLPPCPTGYRQDDAGNFFCCPTPLRILSIGQPANYGGSSDNTNAFQDFMNGNTNGTATMEMHKDFEHITADLLSKFDLVILQALYTRIPYNPSDLWTYTDADAAALRDWVKDKGGALVTMSGYWSDQTIEIKPLNQLLNGSDKWSGLTYNGDDTFSSCPDNKCYCTDNSVAFNGWQTDYADAPALTHDIKKVGVFRGRSITCSGSECQIFAKHPTYGNVGVAKKLGNGRIFAWSDEWVTYTSQWGLTDRPTDSQPDCAGYTAKTSYSVPQFWYNAFKWSVPGNTCFTIIVPPDAPPGQQIIY